MPFNRHIRHTLILTIIMVGTVSVASALQQERSFAQNGPTPFTSLSSATLSPESLSSAPPSSQSSTSTATSSSATSSSPAPSSASASSSATTSASSSTTSSTTTSSPENEQNADLSLTKTASITPVHLGETFLYTLTIHNTSRTISAQNVSVTDTLPAGVTFISADGCTENDQQVICEIGTIAPDSSVNRSIVVQVQENQSLCNTNLLNIAIVSSAYDPNIGNNTADKTTPVLCAEQQEVFSPFCGNENCDPENDETCDTCPQDCGFCPLERPLCNNGLCEGLTDCSSDCLSQAPDSLPQPPPKITPPPVYQEVIEQAPEQSLHKALNELSETIANDRLFQKRLDEAGIILGDGPPAQLIAGIAIELQKERREFLSTSRDILEDPSVEILLRNFPDRNELLLAANDGNLSVMLDHLPEPTQNTQKSLDQLREIMINFPDEFAKEGSLLLPKAVADETPLPMDAKEGLVESVFLRRRMEALGIDPNTGLASLDQDIKNLTERKKTLAGIIGIMEEDLEKELEDAEGSIKQPTTRSLLNVKGIFLYLRATANFETLEKTYRGAVADMRTGMAKFQSLFSFRQFSPNVEAAELVGGELAASLQSPDIGEKKKGTLELFDMQNPLIESMLQELPENERSAHADAFARIRQEATAAEVSAELEQAIVLFSDALTALENDARSEQSILRRPLYFLQDFFGRS